MKVWRPTIYTQKLADKICDRLSDGESLRSVCRDEAMPNKSTVFKWLREYPKLTDQYTRAKQESADAMAEDILDISDNGANDWMEKHDPDHPGYDFNGEHLQRSRLRVDTRKWLMAKMKPKKYGDKLEIAGDKEAPLSIIVKLPWTDNDSK